MDLKLRAAPSITIEIPLEGVPRLRYNAETFEDGERLRLWLQRRHDLYEHIAPVAELADPCCIVTGPPGAPSWSTRPKWPK